MKRRSFFAKAAGLIAVAFGVKEMPKVAGAMPAVICGTGVSAQSWKFLRVINGNPAWVECPISEWPVYSVADASTVQKRLELCRGIGVAKEVPKTLVVSGKYNPKAMSGRWTYEWHGNTYGPFQWTADAVNDAFRNGFISPITDKVVIHPEGRTPGELESVNAFIEV